MLCAAVLKGVAGVWVGDRLVGEWEPERGIEMSEEKDERGE